MKLGVTSNVDSALVRAYLKVPSFHVRGEKEKGRDRVNPCEAYILKQKNTTYDRE